MPYVVDAVRWEGELLLRVDFADAAQGFVPASLRLLCGVSEANGLANLGKALDALEHVEDADDCGQHGNGCVGGQPPATNQIMVKMSSGISSSNAMMISTNALICILVRNAVSLFLAVSASAAASAAYIIIIMSSSSHRTYSHLLLFQCVPEHGAPADRLDQGGDKPKRLAPANAILDLHLRRGLAHDV